MPGKWQIENTLALIINLVYNNVKKERSDAMGTEFELKYRATSAQLERIMAVFPGGYTRIPMTTTYYDTPAGELSARHCTLRHRQEGERHVCTLKTPRPDGARGEWETECDDIHKALDILGELSGEKLPDALVITCGARFTRFAKAIETEDFTAELALDSGVLLNGTKEFPFAEAELELKSGSREKMEEYARLFAAIYGLERESLSKFARASMLGQEE